MTRRRDDLVWLAPATLAGVLVYGIYLWTNPYPAHGAGLYFTMAEEVQAHGYGLPETVPRYTPGGVPFAYPPLGIYALAFVRDVTGAGPLVLSRWLPGPIVVASVVPTYLLARELLESVPGGATVATLVAVNPQLLDWHLSAGGLVRAPAYLFTVTGLYAFFRRRRTGSRRWLGLAIACFGVTVLTHPTYALFYGVSTLALYAGLDRSAAGLVDGAVVGLGGLTLAAPWWLTVVRTHGPDVFLGAMGTHGGLSGGIVDDVTRATLDPAVLLVLLVVGVAVLAGLSTGRGALVGWLAAVSLVMSQPRFTLLVATFLAVAVLPEGAGLPSWASSPDSPSITRRRGPALLLALAVVLATLVGAAYLRDDTAAPRPSVTPNHVDGTDLEAMAWARSATPPDAGFVVLGDAAEWFPLFAERTLLVSPWGAEWEGPRSYARHSALYRTVSRCDTERCLSAALERTEVGAEYVYVPKDTYPVQGTPHRPNGRLVAELRRSGSYRLVFENRGVAVFRVDPAGR